MKLPLLSGKQVLAALCGSGLSRYTAKAAT